MSTERSDKETTPDPATKKPVDTEDERVDSLDIIDSQDFGRNKVNANKKGIYLAENFRQTFAEFRQNKIFSFAFFLYVCLEISMGIEFVQYCAIQKRAKLVDSKDSYPLDCADFAKSSC